jgi:hypothetical protein
VLSALMMLRRVLPALRYATREEEFGPIFGAGVFLVFLGTLTNTLGNDLEVVDSFYFSVSTLTTTSVSEPTWCSTTAGSRCSRSSTSSSASGSWSRSCAGSVSRS